MSILIDNVGLPIVGFNLEIPQGFSPYRQMSIKGDTLYLVATLGGMYFLLSYPLMDGGKVGSVLQLLGFSPNTAFGLSGDDFYNVTGSSPVFKQKITRCHKSVLESILNDIVDIAAPEVAIFLKLLEVVEGMTQQFPVVCLTEYATSSKLTTSYPLFNTRFIQPSGNKSPILAAGDGQNAQFFSGDSVFTITTENMQETGPFLDSNGLIYIVMTEDYSDAIIYLITSKGVTKYTSDVSGVALSSTIGAFDDYLFINDSGIILLNFITGEYFPDFPTTEIQDYLTGLSTNPFYKSLVSEAFDLSYFDVTAYGQTLFYSFTVDSVTGKSVGFRVIPDIENNVWVYGGFQIFNNTGLESGALPFYSESGMIGVVTHNTLTGTWRVNIVANPPDFLLVKGIHALTGGCRC